MSVIIETSLGDLTVDLLVKERPRACMNFIKLCKMKYFNYNVFFNVQRDFIAQTGDPTGSGRGGESVFSKLYGEQAAFFEPESEPVLRHTKLGTVSMANNGHDMHGSQFFVTLAENADYLDGVHTVFGEISEGLDVLQKINESIVDEKNRPYQDIRINHTVILDDPFPDPAGISVPERSPSPTRDQLESGRIAPGESTDDYNGLSRQEVEELIEDKEAKARAQILEMIGDLPDAEVKPPDNVLFVCKLNPVTTDDDLYIIFSRFGQIKSCEVIRDKKSGDSLQYAFIEFETDEHCANAYFKMDNVLIDDRRIHVDFSQSVSKMDWSEKWRQRKNPTGNQVEKPAQNGRNTTKLPKENRLEKGPVKEKSRRPDSSRSTASNGKRSPGPVHKRKRSRSRDRSPKRSSHRKSSRDKRRNSREREDRQRRSPPREEYSTSSGKTISFTRRNPTTQERSGSRERRHRERR